MHSKISISMPKALEEYARLRVTHGGYGSISEYIRELVRIDQRFELAKRDQRSQNDARLLEAARRSSGDKYRS